MGRQPLLHLVPPVEQLDLVLSVDLGQALAARLRCLVRLLLHQQLVLHSGLNRQRPRRLEHNLTQEDCFHYNVCIGICTHDILHFDGHFQSLCYLVALDVHSGPLLWQTKSDVCIMHG